MPRAIALGAASLLFASRAASASDPAAAQALFERGKALVQERRIAEGCRTLQESQRLDPGLGTLFHLADCEERLGHTATAWAEFLEVAAEARIRNQAARAQLAHGRADALAPRLARLTIDPADHSPGLAITRDDVTVGEGAWGVAVPVDPGDHTIAAIAPGHGEWRTTVTVAAGAHAAVTVPLLAVVGDGRDASGQTTTTSAEVDAPSSPGDTQRVVGLVIAGVGVAGAATGGYLALLSKSKHDDSASHCGGDVCDPTGASLRDDAVHYGNIATLSLLGGGAALASGLALFFFAPRDHATTQLAIVPGGVAMRGAW
jgi:hypothetical protein